MKKKKSKSGNTFIETVNFNDIETPTTVQGFRKNLMKYYGCNGSYDPKKTKQVRDELMMMGQEILVDDLNRLDDLYRLDSKPYISPLVEFNMDDVEEYMMESGQLFSSNGFFENTEKYTIYTSIEDYIQHGKPSWWMVDNQILREFYVKTLGKFSGYSTEGSWV